MQIHKARKLPVEIVGSALSARGTTAHTSSSPRWKATITPRCSTGSSRASTASSTRSSPTYSPRLTRLRFPCVSKSPETRQTMCPKKSKNGATNETVFGARPVTKWFRTGRKYPTPADCDRGITVATRDSCGDWHLQTTHTKNVGKPMADWGMLNFGSPPEFWTYTDLIAPDPLSSEEA